MQIAEAIDSARCILALYTPSYWESVPCKDELTAGYIRQLKDQQRLLFPIHYLSARFPSYFEGLQYADCREGDLKKLTSICHEVCAMLPRSQP